MGLKGLLYYFPRHFCVCLEVSITKSLGFFQVFVCWLFVLHQQHLDVLES